MILFMMRMQLLARRTVDELLDGGWLENTVHDANATPR